MSTRVIQAFHWFQQLKQLSAPVFISQEHAAGISYLSCGPITYTIGFHTEGGTGIFPHPDIYDVAVASAGISAITKYNIIIGLIVVAESDNSCP